MARLNLAYILAYLFVVLVIADSVYYLVTASTAADGLAGSIYGAMSIRVITSVAFLLAPSLFSAHAALLIAIEAVYVLATLAILIASSTLLSFHAFVPSLILQVLTLFATGLTLTQEVFQFYGIQDEKQPVKAHAKIIRMLSLLNQNMMAFTTLVSVAVAILVGILIRSYDPVWTPRQLMYLGFLGDLFLRMLKCLILPLIFSSLVFAIGNIDAQLSGKIALRAITYYMATTLMAIIIGIILVSTVQPGKRGQVEDIGTPPVASKRLTTIDTILDLIRNMFPSNIFEACFAYYSTSLKCNETEVDCESLDLDLWTLGSVMESGSANILGVVVFAIVFGGMISQIEQRGVMVHFFQSFNDVMMQMTALVIRITPVAVTFLILPQIIKVPDLTVMFGAIGYYTLCVIGGQAIQGFLVLPGLYFAITRRNPLSLLRHLSPAIITAFGTSSSSATMPVTFTCLEDGARLDKRIVRFCIPIGSTINMDGTALYEAVAAIFIAQYRDVEMSLVKVIIVAITATAASIGAAGIPQGGLVTIIIVLNAVGLPAEDAALIIVIDWFIDRFRTMLNVLGDGIGSAIVDHLSRAEMRALDGVDGEEGSEGTEETATL